MQINVIRRVVVLAAVGIGFGYFSARIVDAFALYPLIAALAGVVGACLIALQLRKYELLSLLLSLEVFAYADYVGIAMVRAVEREVAFGSLMRDWLQGINSGVALLVLLAGFAYAAFVVTAAALFWFVIQRFDRPRLDTRDAAFLEILDRQQ